MFTVGFVQFCPVRYDVWANVATVERLLAGVRADLLVLPELANSGYMYATAADLDPYAEPAMAPVTFCPRCGSSQSGQAA